MKRKQDHNPVQRGEADSDLSLHLTGEGAQKLAAMASEPGDLEAPKRRLAKFKAELEKTLEKRLRSEKIPT